MLVGRQPLSLTTKQHTLPLNAYECAPPQLLGDAPAVHASSAEQAAGQFWHVWKPAPPAWHSSVHELHCYRGNMMMHGCVYMNSRGVWETGCHLTWCPSSRRLTSSSSPLVPTASRAAPNSAWLCCRSINSRLSCEMAEYAVWTCTHTAVEAETHRHKWHTDTSVSPCVGLGVQLLPTGFVPNNYCNQQSPT